MTLVEMDCVPRAKQKQQILFFFFFYTSLYAIFLFSVLSLSLPCRWRWSRIFALQSCTWRRLHNSITCWWQNLQKHPLLLSSVFSTKNVSMRHLVLTLFFNIRSQLIAEIREFQCRYCCCCCCCYPYHVMLLFRPWIRKRGREQKYDVFTYWRTIEKTLYTYNAIERQVLKKEKTSSLSRRILDIYLLCPLFFSIMIFI